MNLRTDWLDTDLNDSDFYTKEETINSVKSNFDIRRYHSAEGYSVNVDDIIEQVIIQDHTNPIHQSDVDKRILLSMESGVHTGSYVKYRNQTWLINSNVNIVDDGYKECQMQLCNYTLLFQSPTGVILSYPCITSSKSFNQDESKIITLPSNQKSILCCFDENTSLIKTDDRFYVDKLNNTTWHVIGAVDNTSFNYGDKGLIYFIVEQDLEQNNTEYPDRPDLGVCNYFEPSGEVEPPVEGYSYATIVSSGSLTVGGFTRTITPTFYESDSTLADGIIAVWDIVLPTGYENQFTITYVDNQVKIKVAENYDLIEKTVTFNVMGSNGGYGGSLMLIITV